MRCCAAKPATALRRRFLRGLARLRRASYFAAVAFYRREQILG